MIKKSKLLHLICTVFVKTGLTSIALYITKKLYPSHIRIVNYHQVPLDELDLFEAQVDYLLSIYKPATINDLRDVLSGKSNSADPFILFTFDDGFESHGSYVADLLKRKNVAGWFFVPTAAPDVPIPLQLQWGIDQEVYRDNEKSKFEEKVFADWQTWEECSKYHVVGTHTHNHTRFDNSKTLSELRYELETSYTLLKERIDQTCKIFCWVGGEYPSYSKKAADQIKSLSTDFAFTTCCLPVTSKTNPLRLERTNLESDFPLDRVKFSVSGILDLKYFSKRQKLKKYFS